MAKQQMLKVIPSDQSSVVYDNISYSSNKPKNELEEQHPALLGHYHDLEKLGHGAQATMLKALDKNGAPVAIKIFEYQKVSEWKEVELFEREISVLKDLNFQGVPKYIETIKTDDTVYLIEEYIDALSLEKQLNSGRVFSLDDCLTILRNTAKILQLLANRIPPIVHRDIKPANILADEKLNIYLVDFGVVANTIQTVSVTFAGTAGYVAPEQLYGKTTPASDIFSLGATILHLVSRIAPCDMKLKGFLPDFDKYKPSNVPEWFWELIIKMMSPDPGSRPQNGNEVLKLIETGKARNLKAFESSKQSQAEHVNIQKLADSADAEKEQTVEKQSESQKQTALAKPKDTKQIGNDILIVVVFAICLFAIAIALGTNNRRDDNQTYRPVEFDAERIFYEQFENPDDAKRLLDLFSSNHSDDTSHNDDTNDNSADNRMGLDYFNRMGLDYLLERLTNAAENGDSDAQYELANMYANGKDVGQNLLRAAKWYEKSANQGNIDAQYAVGVMYLNGDGVDRDEQKALHWLKKSADAGHTGANLLLQSLQLPKD